MKGRALSTACAIAYPLVAHYAVVRGGSVWISIALALLAGSMLIPALVRGQWLAWLIAPVVAAGCWGIQKLDSPVLPLYVAPIIGPTFMAWVFGHTLMAGNRPLIEQMVRIMHPETGPNAPGPEVWPYARRLTLIWMLLFVTIGLTNLVFGLIATPDGVLLSHGVQPPVTVSQHTWSLFANVIGYLLVAGFGMLEYAYRRRRFAHQPFKNFFDFARQVSAAMPKLIKRDV